MLNHKVFQAGKVYGVEIEIISNLEFHYRVVLLQKKNRLLVKSETFVSIDELLKSLDKGIPLVISIDGKGVLHKKLSNKDVTELLSSVLPNANNDDFFVQKYELNKNEAYASVCRNDVVEKLLEQFSANKFVVYKVFLGPFQLTVLDNINRVIQTTNHKIEFVSNKIWNIEKSVNSADGYHSFRHQTISSLYLVAFANALSYFDEKGGLEFNQSNGSLISDYYYSRLYKIGLAVILFLVLLVLSVNYYFLNQYKSDYERLDQQVQINSEYSTLLEKLNKELATKEDIFSKSGYEKNSHLTLYVNEIILIKPDGIKLDKCQYQPTINKIKDNEEIQYSNDVVLVSGFARSSILVDGWAKGIEKLKWVKQVNIVSYNQEASDIPGVFEIIVKLK